jgi:ABC-type branched-subunit amino acid transport system substrate-binding protein
VGNRGARVRRPLTRAAVALFGVVCAAPLAAAALTPEEQAGRRLYLEAVTPSGDPLRALVGVGRTAISGQAVACGNCHGADGKGKPESSVTPPQITWEELTKPYGRVHANRKHRAFDERSFRRAVNQGVDPAGNALDWSMPRYALSASEAAALITYLKRIARDYDPGIDYSSLRIGTVLPRHGRLAPAAQAMREALSAYLETINRAGGIHQRKLELVVMGDYVEADIRFAARPVFALVNPVEPADGEAFGSLLERLKLPVIGPRGPAHDVGARRSRLVFHVLAGHSEQAAVLVDFAARRSAGTGMKAAVVASGASPQAQAAAQRCAQRGCSEVLRLGSSATPFDAAAAVRTLKKHGRDQVFFFGTEREFALLLDAADKEIDASWRPSVYAPGGLVHAALAARARFGGWIFLAFPAAPLEQESSGAAAWERLRGEFGLAAQHEPAQLAALAAASVLVEGLRRAGRELSRERFVRALETLSNFDPGGFARPVSYGPDRRIGALGGYVVALDRERGIASSPGWIALD